MIGILLVTHGRLAEELKAAAFIIQPEISSIVAVALEWSEIGEDARERIAAGPPPVRRRGEARRLEEGPGGNRPRRQSPDGAQVRVAAEQREAGFRDRPPGAGPRAALDLRGLGPARQRGERLGRRLGVAGAMVERELALRHRLGAA